MTSYKKGKLYSIERLGPVYVIKMGPTQTGLAAGELGPVKRSFLSGDRDTARRLSWFASSMLSVEKAQSAPFMYLGEIPSTHTQFGYSVFLHDDKLVATVSIMVPYDK